MNLLALREWHRTLGARFAEMGGEETVSNYGSPLDEHGMLREAAGVLDLGFHGRLCLTGGDRRRFLHGQVTNDVNGLKIGQGCYAALTTAKGKMVSDLNAWILENEILLDFEPGLSDVVVQRLEKYIIADDVQVVNVAPHYGLLSVQGPRAAEVMGSCEFEMETPGTPMNFAVMRDNKLGEVYVMNHPRLGTLGYDFFIPVASLPSVAGQLVDAAKAHGGGPCGWQAFETARIEGGIPRFAADMDDSNLPGEAGLEARAVSFTKGCYIGQEVIARIRTYGQVARTLRGLRLAAGIKSLPVKGDKLVKDGKEVGFITSAVASPAFRSNIALGYVRRESNQLGTELTVRTSTEEYRAEIVPLPFR